MSPELEIALIVAGCASLLTWGIWITTSVMSYNRETKDNTDIKKEFKEMEDRVHSQLDRFDKRQELFLRTEIAEMKSILRNEGIDSGRQRTSK